VPGRRYPLLVYVYGGDNLSERVYSFGGSGYLGNNPQMLATRGYAVLLPDAPVRQGTQVQDLLAAVMPGIDEVIRLGVADSTRLGVWGHSYGGYSTMALVSGSPRFKAAIAGAGFANLLSEYFMLSPLGYISAQYFETGQGGMGGTPWQMFDRYVANSPIFKFDRITAPVLVYAGALDAHQGSDEIFAALKRLGKVAEYRLYAGEEHWVQSRENVADFWGRAISWLDQYLKGANSGVVSGPSQ
jgi:dipeptidyl aminopeptidase/acylaminoacyl peptidase